MSGDKRTIIPGKPSATHIVAEERGKIGEKILRSLAEKFCGSNGTVEEAYQSKYRISFGCWCESGDGTFEELVGHIEVDGVQREFRLRVGSGEGIKRPFYLTEGDPTRGRLMRATPTRAIISRFVRLSRQAGLGYQLLVYIFVHGEGWTDSLERTLAPFGALASPQAIKERKRKKKNNRARRARGNSRDYDDTTPYMGR